MRALLDYVIAVPFALLPRRRWNDWDLPIENVTFASAILTCLFGAAVLMRMRAELAEAKVEARMRRAAAE